MSVTDYQKLFRRADRELTQLRVDLVQCQIDKNRALHTLREIAGDNAYLGQKVEDPEAYAARFLKENDFWQKPQGLPFGEE